MPGPGCCARPATGASRAKCKGHKGYKRQGNYPVSVPPSHPTNPVQSCRAVCWKHKVGQVWLGFGGCPSPPFNVSCPCLG